MVMKPEVPHDPTLTLPLPGRKSTIGAAVLRVVLVDH